ncbi:MAG: tetratricopeptide repeat protein [Deltaproteobacteria bacterium]|nr:tetratricopeptide repeat protein [Deltaproteobacteria bacterium]
MRHLTKGTCMFLIGILVLFSTVPSVFSESLTINSDQQLEYARRLMDEGEYELAITELERFIHFFPESSQVPAAQNLIGICYLREGKYEKARDSFSRTIRSNPGSSFAGKALFMTGETYYEQGVPAEAEHYFLEVLKQYPAPEMKNAVRYRLGWTWMKEDRWKDASEAFSKVETGSPFYHSASALTEESLKGELLPRKDPVTAGVMAGLLPGLGHVYVSRYKDALVAFLLNGLFIWATIESFHQDHNVLGILGFLEVGWYTGNIYSAVNVTHKWNRKVRDDFRKGLDDRFNFKLLTADSGPAGLVLTFSF